MLHGVWLRSAFAVAVSETVPPEGPPMLLEARATPIHVPDTPAEVVLTEMVPAWVAGDCATKAAAMVRVPAVGSTSAVLHAVPSLQNVSLWPLVASRSSIRYPILATFSLADAGKGIGFPGAAIDGLLTAMLTPSQRTSTDFDDAAAPLGGSFWPGVITYAANECRPALPVYATEQVAAWVQAPTRLRSVTSKISMAQGVPVTLGVDFATSSVVAPDASTELSALKVTVGMVGWRRTGAPPAVIVREGSVLHAPGASTGLSPSRGQAARPVGTAELPD